MKSCRVQNAIRVIIFFASGWSMMNHFNRGQKPKSPTDPSLTMLTALDPEDQQIVTTYPFILVASIFASMLLLFILYTNRGPSWGYKPCEWALKMSVLCGSA